MKIKKIVTSIYKLYARNLAILMPLIIFTAILIIFVDRIPYVNLLKDTVITALLSINWFVILWFSKLTTRAMVITALVVFAVTLPLSFMNIQPLVESMVNLCYIILATAFIFEAIQQVRSSS